MLKHKPVPTSDSVREDNSFSGSAPDYKKTDHKPKNMKEEFARKYANKRDNKKGGIMGTVLKVIKRFGSSIVGLLGTGGSLAAGLDINSAVLIGVTGAIVMVTGEIALAKEFKKLFEDDDNPDKE